MEYTVQRNLVWNVLVEQLIMLESELNLSNISLSDERQVNSNGWRRSMSLLNSTLTLYDLPKNNPSQLSIVIEAGVLDINDNIIDGQEGTLIREHFFTPSFNSGKFYWNDSRGNQYSSEFLAKEWGRRFRDTIISRLDR